MLQALLATLGVLAIAASIAAKFVKLTAGAADAAPAPVSASAATGRARRRDRPTSSGPRRHAAPATRRVRG
jgi:hypothetical protein